MELDVGIKHIIDGNAIIIMGAGASFGAQNPFGDFPSGSRLASELYKKCNITPDDENDLQDASQCYEEQFSTAELISEIRTLLTCSSFTESHTTIYSLPWMRYYTTNYDDVALLSAKKNGVDITPVTLTSNLGKYTEKQRLCVHINGHIGHLNEITIHDEFKLTASSYLSQNNILSSEWGNLLQNDLETAKCIFIVGLSLKYDLDLSRILFNPDFIAKTILISSPDLTANAENRLQRYGTVYKIGVDAFAKEIQKIQQEYTPKIVDEADRIYTAFLHDYKRSYDYSKPTPEDVFNLFLNGKYSDSLYYKTDGSYCAFVYREIFSNIKSEILSGKRFIFIHSDMGNGKTACIDELRYSLSKNEMHIFTLANAESTKVSEEIAAISNLSKKTRVLVIFDDYTSYTDILKKFAVYDNSQIQFVLAARTALNYNKMPSVLTIFSAEENSSVIFNLNRIDDVGIKQSIKIFNRYGLFGKRSGLKQAEKRKYLISPQNCNRKFQAIMLDMIQSKALGVKIEELVDNIKTSSKQYHNAVIIILLTKIMNLRLSVLDIEHILGLTISSDALFRSNPSILELIDFNSNHKITIKSSVTAKFILQKVSTPEIVITALNTVASYAVQYSYTPKFAQVLTSIISYSHIHSFLRGFRNSEQVILSYYDELSKLSYYESSNFFWLQYAIACIEIRRFDRAQRYLDTAYGLIPKNFVPFQINNQQARFYLERIVCGDSHKPLEDFQAAHKLLMVPISSPNDNEYNVVQLFGYYCRKRMRTIMANREYQEVYRSACKDAYNRISAFTKHHPAYIPYLKDLEARLMKVYIDENSDVLN